MRVKYFGVQNLETLCQCKNALLVKRFGVQTLETLYMSSDLVFRVWKRFACQTLWCSEYGNVVAVKQFGVQSLETALLSNDLFFRIWTLCACQAIWCPKSGMVGPMWKRCQCQAIWRSESGNVLPSKRFVFRIWKGRAWSECGPVGPSESTNSACQKRCAYQANWFSEF